VLWPLKADAPLLIDAQRRGISAVHGGEEVKFRHGLRVSEACGLVLEQVDVESRILHVARLKGGLSTTHPLRGDEIRAIKAWLVERVRMKAPGRSFFLSDQRKPLNRSTVNLLLRKYGEKARLPVAVYPHMLRHACGFDLADQGADTRLIQDYLGHRNIQHTVRYTATNPARFEKLWRQRQDQKRAAALTLP
jgi:type 1 fimbriae regulatory protein FimB